MSPDSDTDTQPPAANQTAVLFREHLGKPPVSRADRQAVKVFARKLTMSVAPGASFSCVITDDRELRQLNRSFLDLDYATDVLSFPSGSTRGEIGDIAISAERAAEQAGAYGHSCRDEICILMLHGILHLLGHDHERDSGEMAELEDRWRGEFGLPGCLLERGLDAKVSAV